MGALTPTAAAASHCIHSAILLSVHTENEILNL